MNEKQKKEENETNRKYLRDRKGKKRNIKAFQHWKNKKKKKQKNNLTVYQDIGPRIFAGGVEVSGCDPGNADEEIAKKEDRQHLGYIFCNGIRGTE